MSDDFPPCSPFLKWPGGKRWLADVIAARARTRLRGTYFEPFLGAGAAYFRLRPVRAILSDLNADLINTFVQVRDRPLDVIAVLRRLEVSADAYYSIRASRPRTAVRRAARLLYLNRTAFAGMYRLNARGDFNVPYGGGFRTPRILWESRLLVRSSLTLQHASIRASDFEAQLEIARRGDVVYCDPTYTVAHENDGFIRYNERNFSWTDQQRLASACWRASRRGAYVMVSNAFHPSIAELYEGVEAEIVERRTSVSRRPSGRRLVREYLFTFPIRKRPLMGVR